MVYIFSSPMIDVSPSPVKLKYLLDNIPEGLASPVNPVPSADVLIAGLAYDSRHLRSGDLFFALVGGETDGHRFIPKAIEQGAAAIVGEQDIESIPVPYVQVTNSRLALAHLSAAFYDFPARKLTVIGITGTDGKTTTANLIHQILLAAGLRSGLISTVHAVIGEEIIDTGFHVTTPGAPDIQRLLASMVSEGLSHVVLETTSHGLAQNRVAASDFDVGVVTNITHEHLDYHGSYEAYRSAKASIFDHMATRYAKSVEDIRYAILNIDDISYDYLEKYIQQGRLTRFGEIQMASYGLQPPADVFAENVRESWESIKFIAGGPGFRIPVICHLPGTYNLFNCLAAIASTAVALGIDPVIAADGINNLKSIPGRMERIDLGTDFLTIVDFAHTPNALERSLLAIRQIHDAKEKRGRVIAVFGSAGLRDKAKRRMMAEVSANLADISILTAEDPRTESLDGILAEMSSGCISRGGKEGRTFWRVRDRGKAIRFAISMAKPGDVVIAFGKGHEQSMCFGETEHAWDDRTAMRAAVAEYLGIDGPEMPYLPTQDD